LKKKIKKFSDKKRQESLQSLVDLLSWKKPEYVKIMNPHPNLVKFLSKVAEYLYTKKLNENNLLNYKENFLPIILEHTLREPTLEQQWRKTVSPIIQTTSFSHELNSEEESKKIIVSIWVKVWINDWLSKNDYKPDKNEKSLRTQLK
jgi:hypothetical protein